MNTSKSLIASFCILFLSCNPETRLFDKAKESNTIAGYEDYLSKYRNGEYAEEAQQKIQEIRFNQSRDSQFVSFMNKLASDSIKNNAKIIIEPNNPILMGTSLAILLRQLPPKTIVTLHAYRRDWNSLLYSFGRYQSDENGQVSISQKEVLSGTYTGIDALGIFWSMSHPPLDNVQLPFNVKDLKHHTIYFAIECNQMIIATEQLELLEKLPHLVSEKIDDDSLKAMLHYPKDGQHLPVLILLSGSEGGYDNVSKMAQIIASHGYAVLALAYFKIDPLPKYLAKIPLEYLFHAIDWVKRKPNIDSSKIVIAGGSRGGELALLLASKRPDIKGVIAVEPSCVLWQGLPHSIWSIFFSEPAWTLNGKALPYIDNKLSLATLAKFGTDAKQIELMHLYEGIAAKTQEVEPALIKVEHIQGPILLIAGKDSRVWPAYKMCRMMERRLDSLHFTFPVKGLYYENAGHYVTITPSLNPTIDYKYEQLKVGGTESGNAFAQIDSWNKIIEFLKTNFPM